MKLTAPTSAIIAFAPIGFISEQASKNKKSMPIRPPHQQMDYDGQKRKIKSDYALLKNENESVSASNQNKSVNKSAKVCFGGFFNTQKLYTSKLLKRGLEFASDNGALFSSGFALFTATLMRPAAIFATPGVKKENKEYACAKSISSGVIGFLIMAAVSSPIATAVKKINKNPQKYLKEATIKALSDGVDLVKSKKYDKATQLFKLGSDFVCAIPKAMLTCALIPPLMACFFSKSKANKRPEYQSQVICFKSGKLANNSNIFKDFIKEGK